MIDPITSDGTFDDILVFRNPVEWHEPRTVDRLRDLLERIDAISPNRWIAGAFAYEAGFDFQDLPSPPGNPPLAWIGFFDEPVRLPRSTWTFPAGSGGTEAMFLPSFSEYQRNFQRVRAALEEGESYQLNLTGDFTWPAPADSVAFYASLRASQPVPYGTVVRGEERLILSVSPELFFRIQGDEISTRPMKGTRPRHADASKDAALRDELSRSEKDRAENRMIVDLLRNDLGRLAVPGGVEVPSLFRVESHPTVHQMTSDVNARMRDDVKRSHLLRSLHPSGSVIGAPKRSSLKILRDVEARNRGAYCGSLGFFAPDGTARWSVGIRTVQIEDGLASAGAGGGVTVLSDAQDEYAEAITKGRYLRPKPALPFTTFRCEKGIVWDLRHHLLRLRDGALAAGLPWNLDETSRKLESTLRALDPSLPWRIRASLDENGALVVRSTPIEGPLPRAAVRVATDAIDSREGARRHKTDRRALYDLHAEKAKSLDLADFLFFNERGELAEGAIHTVYLRIGSGLFTPPVASGALPGTMRRWILEKGWARERTLLRTDLARAESIHLSNALRPWRRVELEP